MEEKVENMEYNIEFFSKKIRNMGRKLLHMLKFILGRETEGKLTGNFLRTRKKPMEVVSTEIPKIMISEKGKERCVLYWI